MKEATKVVAIMSMSLDGYVADANDGVAEVFDWYFSGDVDVPTTSTTPGTRGIFAFVVTHQVPDGWPRPGSTRLRPARGPDASATQRASVA